MTKCLTIDEMLDVLHDLDYDNNLSTYSIYARQAEDLATALADHLATGLGIKRGNVSRQESALGGTCANFHATHVGQPCPEEIRHLDPTEWSLIDGTDLDPDTGQVQ